MKDNVTDSESDFRRALTVELTKPTAYNMLERKNKQPAASLEKYI